MATTSAATSDVATSSSPTAAATTATGPTTAAVRKREDYISWDDYFMGVAFLSAMRSKDPSTQVGACLVDGENKIVGIGACVRGAKGESDLARDGSASQLPQRPTAIHKHTYPFPIPTRLQRLPPRLQRRRVALGPSGRPGRLGLPGHQVRLRLPRGDECHPQPQHRAAAR